MRSFDDAPFLVIWEVTQACDLACVHCRACAIANRNPFELTTAEGFRLLEEVRSFGDPLMVFTGGDPLKRDDIFPLLERSASLGLRTTVTPSATTLLTERAMDEFRRCGVARTAISMDGPDRASHDGFRRVEGSFARTRFALDYARKLGLPTQVNITVTRHNLDRLNDIARLVGDYGARLWSVFFLVATGRAPLRKISRPKSTKMSSGSSTTSRRRRRSTSRPRKRSTTGGTWRSAVRPRPG